MEREIIMSPQLKELINAWKEQSEVLKIKGLLYTQALTNLMSINTELWRMCQKEGIDMNKALEER
jgi:hypothetical protein